MQRRRYRKVIFGKFERKVIKTFECVLYFIYSRSGGFVKKISTILNVKLAKVVNSSVICYVEAEAYQAFCVFPGVYKITLETAEYFNGEKEGFTYCPLETQNDLIP